MLENQDNKTVNSMDVKFKPAFLNKGFLYLIVIGLIISLIIFITLSIDITFRYMFSALIVFAGLLVVFFINRNEPEKIEIKDNKIYITFFNKSFFKRKPIDFSIQELESKISENGIIHLTNKGKLIAIIRKDALMESDWKELKKLLVSG
ncbi:MULTISPECIES: hypothetical protein [unclassified Lentimicrobium]|uniref:hypothetical protein n=1 Tax=unclassified Lentimicrobium TaxID=2677434 RepID=UPI00155288C1|nr:MULTISPECIES: hypothetical protein [unclassified Lentimicrobium]NPD44851.1 hypothetical protein [Lentimicrobium sp. S6]NPD83124.1 hypothetical protein [Lentimicrobium sp. L6]